MTSRPNIRSLERLEAHQADLHAFLRDRASSASPIPDPKTIRILGLLSRKARWGLTIKGWLVLLAVSVATFLGCGVFLPSFLSLTRPVPCMYLVVEGWAPDYAMEWAAIEFTRGSYQKVFCTGGPLEQGSLLSEFRTHADVAATTLRKHGVPEHAIVSVPSGPRKHGRTWGAALALRENITSENLPVNAVNVVTMGTHARRTHLLFSRALGKSVRVGIISLPTRDYDARVWWKSSQGLKDVLGESMGYLSELLFP